MTTELILPERQRSRKAEWQYQDRLRFKREHGYSTNSHYGAGGLREQVLNRDKYCCVKCGMTNDEHIKKWGRPITIDHIDRDRNNNVVSNLQTLCLPCHGRKDITPKITKPITPKYKRAIITMRNSGYTYQVIADELKLSIATVWKWYKRWTKEAD